MTFSQRFSYTNATKAAVRLILEPWAEEYVIQSGQRVDIVASSNTSDGCVEFEQLSDCLIIYGYPGSVVSLSSNGRELAPATQE